MTLKKLIQELVKMGIEDVFFDATVYVNGKKNFTIKSSSLTRVDINVFESSSK